MFCFEFVITLETIKEKRLKYVFRNFLLKVNFLGGSSLNEREREKFKTT